MLTTLCSNSLSHSKTKVDVDNLNTVSRDLKKLSDVVNKEVVKKLNTKVNKLDKKIPDVTTLIQIN